MAVIIPEEVWASSYKKVFNNNYISEENLDSNVYLWQENNIALFSQLIFSWNAFRPAVGYLKFEGRVRNSITKKWYPWHEMINWGKNVQRSFFNKSKHGSHYDYVRLELPYGEFADAFKIRVIAHNGAVISSLMQLAVTFSNFSLFIPESENYYKNKLSSIKIVGVPKLSQMVLNHERFENICSPTSMAMLTGYITKQKINPVNFANSVYDKELDTYGNWLFNVAHAFEVANGLAFFHVARLNSFRDLYSYLKKKIPVVVSVRGVLRGAPKASYSAGHLIIVIGYNAKNNHVICHDPASPNHGEALKSYKLKDFLIAWERSHRLAYIAEKTVDVNNNN